MKTHIKIKNRHLRIFFGDRFNGWDVMLILIFISAVIAMIRTWSLYDGIKWISLSIVATFIIGYGIKFVVNKAGK